MAISDIILAQPFQTRNADEFLDESILDLFVDPTVGVAGPFDYNNKIIKGTMGTGKTMYLRANHRYYLSMLVPQMMERTAVILPVYIKLSDYQNIQKPEKIYDAILIRLIQEIVNTAEKIQSANELVKLHEGIQDNIFGIWFSRSPQKSIIEKLNKLTSLEYVEKVGTELKTSGTVGNSFISACGDYGKSTLLELKKAEKPQITDFVFAYEKMLRPINARLLVLFDEVGSIHKSFFEEREGTSFFETLMNQLRTLDFVRTKVAVYPHTAADILTETRYGDVVELEDDIYTTVGYDAFLNKSISIAEKYLSAAAGESVLAEAVFDISSHNTLLLEQIIYAADGNMRRLVQLLDATLDECYKRCQGNEKATIDDSIAAIKNKAMQMERLYHGEDLEFLHSLAAACKKRTAYKFKFPNKSLSKYTSKSSEFNILKIIELGTGRRGTTYSFDYSYCVYADIPTHYQYDSERIARTRSAEDGKWISTVTTISDELLVQTNLPGKIDGKISFITPDKNGGFITSDDGEDYFFMTGHIILGERGGTLRNGRRVRFLPLVMAKVSYAAEIELL